MKFKLLFFKILMILVVFLMANFTFAQQKKAPNGKSVVYTTDFESFTAGGQVACQNSTNWSTWSNAPCGEEDAYISTNFAHSGTKAAKVELVNDELLLLGDKTSGSYELSWWMYIENDKGGYYNMQHFQNPGIEPAFDIYFLQNGGGEFYTAGAPAPITFTYPKATWFQVKHIIDIDNDLISLYIDDILVNSWPLSYTNSSTTGTKQLGAIDFFAGASGSETPKYYFDDVYFGDVQSTPGYAKDIAIKSILTPVSGLGLTSSEVVTIKVRNSGTDPQSDIPVNYTIDGGTPVSEVIAGPLAGGAQMDYAFTQTADLSTAKTYEIVASAALAGDENPDNNSKTITVTNLGNQILMQNGSVSSCDGLFYDSGGPDATYQPNEDLTFTLLPGTPGARVKINFTVFDTENNYDFLKIYDGNDVNATLLGSFSGATLPGEFEASQANASGALTFHFTSDGSSNGTGWAATVSCLAPMEHDLGGVSVTGLNNLTIGTSSEYTVTIGNFGVMPETGSNYSVKLYDGNNTEIGTMSGVDIAPGETKNFTFTWTPVIEGSTYLYGKVFLNGDLNPANDRTPNFNVNVQPAGQTDVTIGTGTELCGQPTPMYLWFGYSFSQTLYLQSEINTANKRIYRIGYQYAGLNPNLEEQIEVWLSHTALTELTASVPLSGFTKVYDGQYICKTGEAYSYIDIDPFYYNNTDNLIVTVIEKKPGYTTGTDQYYSTLNSSPQSMCIGAQNDPTPYDPNNLPSGNVINYRANIKLFFGDVPTTPAVKTSPESLNFGEVEATVAKTMNVEVSNVGGGNLEITGANITNSHYTILNDSFPINLGIGEKHIFNIQFIPTEPQLEEGTITFLMADTIPGSKSTQLTGRGLRFGILRESFEGELFPPLGWKVIDDNGDGKGWLRNTGFAPTGQTAPRTGIACASLDVYAGTPGQTSYDDWLITPEMVWQNGDVFKFYVKRLADQAGQLWRVCISTTGSDVSDFSPIDEISDPPLSYVEKSYDLSQHGLSNGDHYYIGLQFNSMWCWPGVIDDVLGSVLVRVAKDLKAMTFTGNDVVYANTVTNYQAVVGNYGLSPVSAGDYTVQVCAYVNGQETVFATVAGDSIAVGETKTLTIPVSIPTIGVYGLYSKVVWSEDLDPTNNISQILSVEVIGNSVVLKNIGDFPINAQTQYYYYYPINFSEDRKSSLTQSMYFANELNTGGIIERLSYYKSIGDNMPQRKIKIWMGETNQQTLDTYIPPSQLKVVFDGKVDFTEGIGKVNINLTTPIVYTGNGNLVVLVYYYDGTTNNDNSLFAYKAPDYGPNRTIFESGWGTIDPENPSFIGTTINFPYTSLMFETGNGLGNLSGRVLYQADNTPVDSAKVEIINPDYPEANAVLYTNANGDYTAPYLMAGNNIKVIISKFGYNDAVYDNVVLANGGSVNLGNASLVPRPHIAVTGFVRKSDTHEAAQNAIVKLNGIENYQTTTDENGNFEFSEIWGSTTYQIEVSLNSYQTYQHDVPVPDINYTFDTITILENAPRPNLVNAVEQSGNALVTWYAAGKPYPMEFRHDDGEAVGVLITPGVASIVGGSSWNYNAIVTGVQWYNYEFPGYASSPLVMISILGLNEDGSPDPNNVLYTQGNVTNEYGWNSLSLPVGIEAPNGFFFGISGYSDYTLLAYDDGEGEPYTWQSRTQWSNGLGAYYPLENATSPPLRANLLIRASGLTQGDLLEKHQNPNASYVVEIPEEKPLFISKKIEAVNTGQPKVILPVVPQNNTKEFVNYNIYRKAIADVDWMQISTTPVTDTSYIDTEWSNLTYGLYNYGVEAEYTNGVKSELSISNVIEKNMRLTLNLIVNTNTGVPALSHGANVILRNQNGNVNYVYDAIVGDNGSVEIPNVMKGIYTLEISHVGFENFTENNINLDIPDTVFEKTVTINERIFDPYDVEVSTAGQSIGNAKFLWNQAPVLDDVESYDPFLIDNIGDWKVIDQDANPTVYANGITFPHYGEPLSFMTFNPSLTTPPLSPEYWGAYSGNQYFASFGSASGTTSDWLISKKQNHSLPFTLSFYAKAITEDYGLETFRIGYSTGGNNISDFVFITTDESPLTYWTKFSYNIPAEAKYVAIRHNHTGFALLIDDVSLGVETDGAIPANGFSVYLNNIEVATGLTTPEYEFTNLTPGNYTAGVKAHFYTGESELKEVNFEIPQGTDVNFTVTDNHGSLIDGADIHILYKNNEILTTQTVNGIASIELYPGTYQYVISKEGFASTATQFIVDTTSLNVNVVLSGFYNLTFVVKDNDNQPIEGATVVYKDENQVTGEDGSVSFITVSGTFSYAVTHPNYNRVLSSVTVVGDMTENVVMPELTCETPGELSYEQYYNNVKLDWLAPVLGNNGTWMHWDVQHGGTSIGTGGAVDFDVAQRFVPSDLTQQGGKYLTRVLFVPGEAACTYSVRVWVGGNISAPETLVVDQVVTDPVIGQWNEIFLNTPVLVDSTKELWIGIRNNTTTGHPAGCDVGPAINGKGNMINLAGTGWQTLLQVSSSLNYNWNVRGLLEDVGSRSVATLVPLEDGNRGSLKGVLSAVKSSRYDGYDEPRVLLGYNIFRNDTLINANPVTGLTYTDLALPVGSYTYKLTSLWSNGCISDYSNSILVDVAAPVCPAPTNLSGNQTDVHQVTLTWEKPPVTGQSQWISYSGDQSDAIGTNNVADFDVAQRYSPFDFYNLGITDGALTKIDFFPYYQACEYSVRVWVGGDASAPGEMVVDQVVSSFTNQSWNEIVLNTPVPINTSQELWIGIRCNTTGGRPAACDAGPAINGKGNMMYWQGAWTTLSAINPALNYNWCIKGYVDVNAKNGSTKLVALNDDVNRNSSGILAAGGHKCDFSKSEKSISGYNVFRNGALLATVSESEYIDNDALSNTNNYCVSAVYDYCESEKVCVDVFVTPQSVLSVTPTNQNVTSATGTTTFAVANTGAGTMNYTAAVTTGNDWLTITSGASGTNNGTIAVSYTENVSTSPRVGTITVTALGATGSPVQVTVTQAANSGTLPALTIGTLTNVTAGSITVPVHAANIVNMGSFQFTIEYDPSLMTYTGTSNWYTGVDAVTVGNPSSGKLTFVWAADLQGINIADGNFFNIDFTWLGSTLTSALTWSDNPTLREFADYNGNIFVPVYNNGSVTGGTAPQPVLSVTPTNQDVTSAAGTTSFVVANNGTGTMNYTAAVTTGNDWLTITSGGSGVNTGTINVAYTENISTSPRTGMITVTAPGATGSPVNVTVTQAAASGPAAIVTITDATTLVSGPFVVPVHAKNISNMGSFQFTIEYDPSIITYTSVSNWYTGIEAVTTGNPSAGHITFVWAADLNGINIADGNFFDINFDWMASDVIQTQVNWSDNPTPREFADYDGNIFVPVYNNGTETGPDGIPEIGSSSIKVFPNPASNVVNIEFTNNISNIRVVNNLGMTVYSENVLNNKTVILNTSSYSSGNYVICFITKDGKVFTKKVFIGR